MQRRFFKLDNNTTIVVTADDTRPSWDTRGTSFMEVIVVKKVENRDKLPEIGELP